MRARGRNALAVAVLLAAAELAAQPTRLSGPATAALVSGGGSVTTTSVTPTTGPTTTVVSTSTITTTPVTATTSTTILGQAPGWVYSMLGVWMMDEASGTRPNLAGNAALNLASGGGTPPTNDTTTKMEGAASAVVTNAGSLTVTSTALDITSPLTLGAWVEVSSGSYDWAMSHWGSSYGYILDRNSTLNWGGMSIRNGGTITDCTDVVTPSAGFHHFVGVYNHPNIYYYQDGVLKKTCTASGTPGTQAVIFGAPEATKMNGHLDECFIVGQALSAAAICRICSCGLRGEQCTCSGTSYTSSGRNASNCGSCTLPACNAATPP